MSGRAVNVRFTASDQGMLGVSSNMLNANASHVALSIMGIGVIPIADTRQNLIQ